MDILQVKKTQLAFAPDELSKAINKYTNIKPKSDCGCKRRQEKLNRVFPYRRN